VIDHVLDELRAAGVKRVVAVTREGKEALEEHLRAAGAECVRQPEPLGLGHAVAQAEPLLAGAPFAVALPDSLFRTPAVMRSVLEAGPHAVAVERVPRERVSRFGIVAVEAYAAPAEGEAASLEGDAVALTDGRVSGVVEKPAPADAPSDLAIAARYLLGPTVFDALRATAPDATGELGLAQALDLLAREERLSAVPLPAGARRVDVGTLAAYEDAQRAS
jgi:UTP--glucose-1-phosphate uridylyltransferase